MNKKTSIKKGTEWDMQGIWNRRSEKCKEYKKQEIRTAMKKKGKE